MFSLTHIKSRSIFERELDVGIVFSQDFYSQGPIILLIKLIDDG